MTVLNNQQKIHYTLRWAVAMCFIGHGAFGIITKPIWCNYFAVFGIDQNAAYSLMPLVGSFDLLMGIGMLLYPIRVIPFWLLIWGTITALLRPLSGEPFAECIERAENVGAPLALLILSGGPVIKNSKLFTTLNNNPAPDAKTWPRVFIYLKLTAFLLLAGHGWLNLIGKKSLLTQYSSIGFSDAGHTAFLLGIFEILSALFLLLRPSRPVVLIILLWKITSELFYPSYGFFEWVERGGSYGVLLALWFALEVELVKVCVKQHYFIEGSGYLR